MFRAIAIVCALAGSARSNVSVYESKQDAVTEGDAILATDPDTAYRALTDYRRWLQVFRDIRSAVLLKQSGNEARVRLVHTDGSHDELHFKNRPAAHTMWFEQKGGDADVWAEIAFHPGVQPGTCRVHTRLYADVKGFSGWFANDDDLRKQRQQHVRDDLQQLVAYFARR